MTTTSRPRAGEVHDPGWGAYLVRTTGLLLFVLLAAHVVDTFILHDVQSATAQTFTDRWATPLWRALDWALVVLALVHGVLGLRPVISSGIASAGVRAVLLSFLYGGVGVLLALVTFVALTFRFT